MKLFLLFIIFYSPISLLAQFEEVNSWEMIIPELGVTFFVQPVDRAGIIIFREIRKNRTSKERNWEIMLFDRDFNREWKRQVTTHLNYTIFSTRYFDDTCYFLFYDPDNQKNAPIVLRLNPSDLSVQTFELIQPLPFHLEYFEVMGNTLLMAGSEKDRPSSICYKFGDRRPMVLAGLYEKRTEILEVEALEDTEIFRFYISFKMPGRKRSVMIKDYDLEGEIVRQLLLQTEKGYTLLNGKIVGAGPGRPNDLVVGSFSSSVGGMADGIYTVKINATGDQEFKFYAFANLKHFFSYLLQPAYDGQVRNSEILTDMDKNTYYTNIIFRDPIIKEEQLIFLGECYQRQSSYMDWYYRYPMGFDFTHAVIIAVSPNTGNILWDNAVSLLSTKRAYNNLQKGYLLTKNESTLLFYHADDHISFQEIGGVALPGPPKQFEISRKFQHALGEPPDTRSVLVPWYDNSFLLYGNWYFGETSKKVQAFFMKQIAVDMAH